MATCEFCGKEVLNPVKVRVAGYVANSCENCQNMGTTIDQKTKSFSFYKSKREQLVKTINPDYQKIVNRELAKRNMTVKRLAEVSNIKESSLTKFLSGKIHIDVQTAEKLEKVLDIKLVSESLESQNSAQDYIVTEDKTDNVGSSLGDLIKAKLKK